MSNSLDLKSMAIGFLSAALLISVFSFKNGQPENTAKFQTVMAEKGLFILDTHTGNYIINTDASNMGWRKGNFETTFKASKDNISGK